MSKLFLRLTAAIAVAIPALIPAVAHAELPNGAVLTFEKLQIHEDGGALKQPSTPEALRYYLNAAHCACGKAGQGKEQSLTYNVRLSADTNTDRPAEFWVGSQCDDATARVTMCRKLDQSIGNIDLLAVTPETVEFNLYDIFSGLNNATHDAECPKQNGGTATIFTLVDSNGDTTIDYTATQNLGATTDVTGYDTLAPPLPTEFEGASAESSIELSWKAPATASDVFAYQALCAKADGTAAFTKATNDARYQTAHDLCGASQDVVLSPETIEGGDPGTATIPQAIKDLDPTFICGESTSSTTTGLRIDGLENGQPYVVALLTIDKFGNTAGVSFSSTITPKPATDFWEDLHDRGSDVEGGFCVSGNIGGNGAGLTAGLLSLAIASVIVRRKRRAGPVITKVLPLVAVLFVVPHTAHAQSITPYWEETQEADGSGVIEGTVKWNVGIRLGPYTPGIDKQFGGTGRGPYAEMFGGYKILPMLDIDRIVWRGFGQLGFGGSIGYMQNTANAWAEGSTPGMKNRPRSEGDENVFRVVPLALTATYRLTVLDDVYGIPIIPYVRGGLAYYVWWLRTNGDTAGACWDGTHKAGCDADKALGATIGVVGSIGLAVRAERIDRNSAISMRQSGIEHAGFYAELSAAKVDGFGSDYKLSVGDTTWFAGVNFEF